MIGPVSRCPECLSRLDVGQRYCLACGARVGALPRVALAPWSVAGPRPPFGVAAGGVRPPFAFPAPPVAATIVLAMVAFGFSLAPRASTTLASRSAPIVVVATTAPAAAAAGDEGEDATAEATPEPAPVDDGATSLPPLENDAALATAAASSPAPPAPAATAAPAEPERGSPSTPDDTATPPAHVALIRLPLPAEQLPALAAYRKRGVWLSRFRPVGDGGLADLVALLTGTDDCQDPAAACAIPADVPTLLSQLDEQGKTWRAYVEDVAATASASDPFPAFAALAGSANVVPLAQLPGQPPASAAPAPAASAPAALPADATTPATPPANATTPANPSATPTANATANPPAAPPADATTQANPPATPPADATTQANPPAAPPADATTPADPTLAAPPAPAPGAAAAAATTPGDPTASPPADPTPPAAPANPPTPPATKAKPPNLALILPGAAKRDPAVADPWLVQTIAASSAELIVVQLADGVLLLGPDVASGTEDRGPTDTYVLLRTLEDVFGLPTLGRADDATSMPWSQDVHGRTTGS